MKLKVYSLNLYKGVNKMTDKGKNGNIAVTVGNQIVNYFLEIKSEIKRMTWPDKKAVKKAVIAVVFFCAIYIVMIAAFDFCFKNLYKLVFKM